MYFKWAKFHKNQRTFFDHSVGREVGTLLLSAHSFSTVRARLARVEFQQSTCKTNCSGHSFIPTRSVGGLGRFRLEALIRQCGRLYQDLPSPYLRNPIIKFFSRKSSINLLQPQKLKFI